MPSLATAGSVSPLLASLHALAKRFVTLATADNKQAGLRLLSMLGLALLAAGLAITGWRGLLPGIVLALVQNTIVSGGVALGIGVLLSFACTGRLALMMIRRSPKSIFAATRRQLWPRRNLKKQEVEEGRLANYAQYQVVRKRLHRRLGSPLIIGGGMLAGITVGYLMLGRRQPKDQLEPGRPSTWTQGLGSVHVLTPLWTALQFATRPQATAALTSAPQPNGGGKATAGEGHGS